MFFPLKPDVYSKSCDAPSHVMPAIASFQASPNATTFNSSACLEEKAYHQYCYVTLEIPLKTLRNYFDHDGTTKLLSGFSGANMKLHSYLHMVTNEGHSKRFLTFLTQFIKNFKNILRHFSI